MKKPSGFILKLTLLLAVAALLSGCAASRVQVWEHDILAKPEMQFGANAHNNVIDDHIYFSKEASSGGRGFGGGGCGCN
jgi:hypothetical protein